MHTIAHHIYTRQQAVSIRFRSGIKGKKNMLKIQRQDLLQNIVGLKEFAIPRLFLRMINLMVTAILYLHLFACLCSHNKWMT